MLIVDGEDLEQQLEDTRRDVEDLIQTQQAENGRWTPSFSRFAKTSTAPSTAITPTPARESPIRAFSIPCKRKSTTGPPR